MPPSQKRLVYILGDNIASPEQHHFLLDVISSGEDGHEIVRNFSATGNRTAVNYVTLRDLIRGAQVIHFLCHGVVEEDQGMFLELDQTPLGRLKPHHVRAFDLRSTRPLVFVNACSSASATFSAAGLTTFGWSFLQAGAAAYIGTLAPVTTDSALRFAKAFFEAYLNRGLTVPEAMFQARQIFKDDPDPTWLLYTLYGDLHVEETPTE